MFVCFLFFDNVLNCAISCLDDPAALSWKNMKLHLNGIKRGTKLSVWTIELGCCMSMGEGSDLYS